MTNSNSTLRQGHVGAVVIGIFEKDNNCSIKMLCENHKLLHNQLAEISVIIGKRGGLPLPEFDGEGRADAVEFKDLGSLENATAAAGNLVQWLYKEQIFNGQSAENAFHSLDVDYSQRDLEPHTDEQEIVKMAAQYEKDPASFVAKHNLAPGEKRLNLLLKGHESGARVDNPEKRELQNEMADKPGGPGH